MLSFGVITMFHHLLYFLKFSSLPPHLSKSEAIDERYSSAPVSDMEWNWLRQASFQNLQLKSRDMSHTNLLPLQPLHK